MWSLSRDQITKYTETLPGKKMLNNILLVNLIHLLFGCWWALIFILYLHFEMGSGLSLSLSVEFFRMSSHFDSLGLSPSFSLPFPTAESMKKFRTLQLWQLHGFLASSSSWFCLNFPVKLPDSILLPIWQLQEMGRKHWLFSTSNKPKNEAMCISTDLAFLN